MSIPIPTDDAELSAMLKQSLGWHWPPHDFRQTQYNLHLMNLPIPVIRYFRDQEPDKQQKLVRFKEERKNTKNVAEMEELYRSTWRIRLIFVDSIVSIYTGHDVDNSFPQYWEAENLSELYWLRLMNWMMINRKKKTKSLVSSGKEKCKEKQDYPVFINFIPCDPLQSNQPIPMNPHVQVETIKIFNLNDQEDNFRTIGFQDTLRNNCRYHDICLKRKHPFPNIMISHHVDRIGFIWVEKFNENDNDSKDPDPRNKKFRILFQKTCSDLDLGLSLWPQFNVKKIGKFFLESQSNYLPEAPRIPIFQNQILELCDQDRLLLFTTQYRSHRIFINLQISIEFCWASGFGQDEESLHFQKNVTDKEDTEYQQEPFEWIDNIFQWPNPCERYAHYLKPPNSYPIYQPKNHDEEKEIEVLNRTTPGQLEESESLDEITVDHIEDDELGFSEQITTVDQLKNEPESPDTQLNHEAHQKSNNDSIFELAQTPELNSSASSDGSDLNNDEARSLSHTPNPKLTTLPSGINTEDEVNHDEITKINEEIKQDNQSELVTNEKKVKNLQSKSLNKAKKNRDKSPDSDKYVKRRSQRIIATSTTNQSKNNKRKK